MHIRKFACECFTQNKIYTYINVFNIKQKKGWNPGDLYEDCPSSPEDHCRLFPNYGSRYKEEVNRFEKYILEVEWVEYGDKLKWEVRQNSVSVFSWLYTTKNRVDRYANYWNRKYWKSNNKREVKRLRNVLDTIKWNVKNVV